jgi:hypothetical protein
MLELRLEIAEPRSRAETTEFQGASPILKRRHCRAEDYATFSLTMASFEA